MTPNRAGSEPTAVDVAVVGGGIAGMSAAYFLSEAMPSLTIAVFEAEAVLTHHTTGRSAAVFIENYGALALRPPTLASKSFLLDPPADLADGPLLSPRGYLAVAGPGKEATIDTLIAEGRAINPAIDRVAVEDALRLAPHLRPEHVSDAIYEPDAADIDVAGLHQAFVRGFRRNGGEIHLTVRVAGAESTATGWRLDTTAGPVATDLIVNAAGAWGDVVAASAGVAPVGLKPLRRTAFMVNSPFPASGDWPLVADADHAWYTNPDGSQFLCSPADETPSEPMDAKPEEVDIARAIESINEATTLEIRSVTSAWAGLRTFSPDRGMVIGPDPAQPNFFWCVGQGGTGIQTSAGAGTLVADLVASGSPGPTFEGTGIDLAGILPDRFGART